MSTSNNVLFTESMKGMSQQGCLNPIGRWWGRAAG